MDTGSRQEDLKGAALLLSERSPLKAACMIFYMIFCTQGELISFPLLEGPSEGCFCRNFDVTGTNQNIMPFYFHVPLEMEQQSSRVSHKMSRSLLWKAVHRECIQLTQGSLHKQKTNILKH